MKVKIVLLQDTHGYHAFIEGRPETRCSGASGYEALGKLMHFHQADCNIEVVLQS